MTLSPELLDSVRDLGRELRTRSHPTVKSLGYIILGLLAEIDRLQKRIDDLEMEAQEWIDQ